MLLFDPMIRRENMSSTTVESERLAQAGPATAGRRFKTGVRSWIPW